mmetsp:Transcript_16486/g.18190  ORF Transcript_16486/g.18190 Transcript_16486/m.18190 type:complete len:305 (-) Transcript_16486:64-978(-)
MNKLLSVCLVVHGVTAFAPVGKPFAAVNRQQQSLDVVALSMNAPFFASEEESTPPAPPAAAAAATTEVPPPPPPLASPSTTSEADALDQMTMEEEVEVLASKEISKMKRASNLRNANGVEYAPWMNITPEAEGDIKKMMKQKAEARRKRKDEEAGVSGALLMDSQAQELSGGGLQSKVVSDTEIELSWATNSELSTKGFAIKRRKARTEEFETIASHENWGPLASKGPDGGTYSYLDDGVSPGGWVYRITECETNGSENDICQALVDVQTKDEQQGAVIAAVGIVLLGVGALAAGVLLDPVGGY